MSSVNSYCTIIFEYLVVRDVNIISVKLRCLHPTSVWFTPVRGVGGKLSRLVYLAPRLGFVSGSVISQFLLHHNLGIFSCKRYKHYFRQTKMFISNISLVTLVRGSILSEILGGGGGKINRTGQLAPHPLSIHNPTEPLK